MKILVIRMMGFGDVTSILVPAVRAVHRRHPGARIEVMTYGAGVAVMELVAEVAAIHPVGAEQWPRDLVAGIHSFSHLAARIVAARYDLIVNLDTWFMPCFLARQLRDIGETVEGNIITWSIEEFQARLNAKTLTQADFSEQGRYLASTYPAMTAWTTPWWEGDAPPQGYPTFYLRACCGFDGPLESRIDVPADTALRDEAAGRPIIAVSASGSRPGKRYRRHEALIAHLEAAGFFVWDRFDGTLPVRATLGRLAVTDLLVTVPTSTQWLARAVGCPSLLIPGPLPPAILGAEAAMAAVESCQFCGQMTCPRGLDFPCLDLPPERIVAQVVRFLAGSVPDAVGNANRPDR